MVNVEEGLKIVQKKFPERCYTIAFEFDKSFVFNSFDRSWDGNPDTAKVGRGPDVVDKKTGNLETLGSADPLDEEYGEFLGKINLDKYLSEDDVKLKNKILSVYHEERALN